MNAEERAWEVVRRAFEEREPVPRRRRGGRLVGVAAVLVVAAVLAAAFSPAGHAVFERVREAVGVENATHRLGPLPAPGRLLVVSAASGGVWIVDADGGKHELGTWADAAWSPFGRYLVVTNGAELEAVEPDGTVRWALSRPSIAWPRWEGTHTDTRIAYLSGGDLRAVAGDGTGDRVLARGVVPTPPAWDPARGHAVAYERDSDVILRTADEGRVLWRTPVAHTGTLLWSSDGSRLAIVSPRGIAVLNGDGRLLRTIPRGARGAAFRPGTHTLALERRLGRRSEVVTLDVDRPPGREHLLFAGPGTFGDVAWSPNGRWLLVDWPTADQWVFLRGGTVRAVGRIAEQFPRLDDRLQSLAVSGNWCCRR